MTITSLIPLACRERPSLILSAGSLSSAVGSCLATRANLGMRRSGCTPSRLRWHTSASLKSRRYPLFLAALPLGGSLIGQNRLSGRFSFTGLSQHSLSLSQQG